MAYSPERLKKLIENGGVPYSQNASSYKFDCPRCRKSQKLWILKHNGYFVCWYCKEIDNFKGRAEYALSELLGRPVPEIRSTLYGEGYPAHEMVDEDWENSEDYEEVEEQLPEIDWPVGTITVLDSKGLKGMEYLLKRGITQDVAERYDLRYWPAKERVLFPVKMGGRLLGYQARAIFPTDGTKIPKILTSPGLRREKMIMFYDRLVGSSYAVICEGPIDAIKADLCGGNIATMGKAISDGQVELILKTGIQKVYFALDRDADDEVQRLSLTFSHLEMYQMRIPDHRDDFGDCDPQEVLEAFAHARRHFYGMPGLY